jgi:hypothetical protein
LKKILSYMSIDNILNGLGVTTKGMVRQICGLCRIKCVVVDETFESRQNQALASTSFVSKITCVRLRARDEWSRLMRADAFKNITSLELKPSPSNHFWLQVPHKFLARIKNLSMSMVFGSHLPFEHLTNVVGLRWDVDSVGSAYVCNLAKHLHRLEKLQLLFVKDTIARTKGILCRAKDIGQKLTAVELCTWSTVMTNLDLLLDEVNYVGLYFGGCGSGVMHGISFGPKLKHLMCSCDCLQLVLGPSQSFGSLIKDKIRNFVVPLKGDLQFSTITNRREMIEHVAIGRFRQHYVRDFPFLPN